MISFFNKIKSPSLPLVLLRIHTAYGLHMQSVETLLDLLLH